MKRFSRCLSIHPPRLRETTAHESMAPLRHRPRKLQLARTVEGHPSAEDAPTPCAARREACGHFQRANARNPLGSILSLLAVLAFSTATIVHAAARNTLDIYWTDVEGGAATLIVTPAGESILIDSGNPGVRDPGRIFDTASKAAGLKKIDYMITTHMHIDHFGGAAELAQLIPIGTVYDNGIPEQSPDNNPNDRTWPLTIKPYREMPVEKRVVIHPGDTLPLRQKPGTPKMTVRCLGAKQQFHHPANARLAANPDCADAKLKEKDTSDNANSIVTLVEFGDFQFFVAGDLTWNVEKDLVCPANLAGTVDVYQVTHHGLDVSNHPLVVRSLAPTVAIMSNGTQKGCGPETFATLKGSPSIQAIYQIHKNLRKDSEINTSTECIANLEAKCQGNRIQLSVDPTAKSYTVSIPATGHRRTFQTK
jgi:beta-lactamase superfamily II metal-dependent hydrolase